MREQSLDREIKSTAAASITTSQTVLNATTTSD
ncbi:uncharacterized protein CLUP02_08243 [Colletotrichum lupini]|uniref:Uncharacterized protein n=1 Tax=Colletotrichum lupini TaxID=145971 RepID=A0A9Q8SSQ7_9PEZI|nr:uncharacterized protein CLUP02_08243 [Colletotrichum lupini]UQC82753.1 hypothetical protein CLUP02_08243 [Colletotrichum lupini]